MLAQAVMLLVYWGCNQFESRFGHPLMWLGNGVGFCSPSRWWESSWH